MHHLVKLFPELSTHLRKFVVLIHFGPKVVPRWMLEELLFDLNYMYITVGKRVKVTRVSKFILLC